MSADILEKEKESPVVASKDDKPVVPDLAVARERKLLTELQLKQEAFCRKIEESFAKKEQKLIEDLQASHILERDKLQEAARVREQKLLAEMEHKHDKLYRDLEESFAQREKNLVGAMQLRYLAECEKIERAATEREQALLVRVGVLRRQLIVVILGALLSLAALWAFRERSPESATSVLPPPAASGESVTSPVVVGAVTSLPAEPAPEAAVAPKVLKTGNGGNFIGGRTSGK